MELAIEISNLSKNFGQKQALAGLNMSVPKGAIYGFIGENGSGKSTTEKIVCGLINASGGSVKLFGKSLNDCKVRAQTGVLIEAPGCFANYTVWNNLMLQAYNLGLENPQKEVRRVLTAVRMEGSASNKYKNCSLGMKQRIGIAMALLGDPKLLVLDEPINGLDADGVRIMREILIDLAQNHGCTILISSHILGELEKIATHYGIIRDGKMIREMTAEKLEKDCPVFIAVKAKDMQTLKQLLSVKYSRVSEEKGYVRVYDGENEEQIVNYLYSCNFIVSEIKREKIGLEEYYIKLMKEKDYE